MVKKTIKKGTYSNTKTTADIKEQAETQVQQSTTKTQTEIPGDLTLVELNPGIFTYVVLDEEEKEAEGFMQPGVIPKNGITIDLLSIDSAPTLANLIQDHAKIASIDTSEAFGTIKNNIDSIAYNLEDGAAELIRGKVLTDSFKFTTTNGLSGTVTLALTETPEGTQPLNVTVTDLSYADTDTSDTDTNTDVDDVVIDIPTISGDVTGAVTEDGIQTATGTIAANGTDTSGFDFQAATGIAGTYGSLDIATNGAWTYTLDNDSVQSLADGVQVTDSVNVLTTDGTTATITITITGTNDIPVITGDVTGAVTEDATNPTLSTSGSLTIADVDLGESEFTPETVTGTYGSLTIAANGAWTYTADNTQTAVQELGAGDTLTESLTVTSSDGSAQQTITITIVGTNDVPVAVADVAATTENAAITIDVLANDTDLDTSDTLTVTDVDTTGTQGSVTITNNGADVSYDPGTAFDSLAVGETATDTFTYTISDGHGGTDTGTVTITIVGTNDVPTIGGIISGSVIEDTFPTVSGQLTITDPDRGEDQFQPATGLTGSGGYGSLSITEAGVWSYTLGTAAQALTAGEVVEDIINVQSNDGTTQPITITITGTNDIPVITGDVTGTATEDTGIVINGSLNIADPDAGESAFIPGSDGDDYGTFNITANGDWTYTLNNTLPEIQQLGVGDSLIRTYTVETVDDTQQDVTITIVGTNDNPIAVADINAIPLGSPVPTVGNVLINDTDIDTPQAQLSVSDPGIYQGDYGTLTIAADGNYSYALDIDLNDSLVAKWAFNEGSGITSADTAPAGGTSDTASLANGAAFTTDSYSGNYAIAFDGINDIVRINNTADINLGTYPERTVNLSFKADDTTGRQVIYEEGAQIRGLIVYLDGDTLYVGGWNTQESSWDGTYIAYENINADEWYNVTLVLDGDTTVQPDAFTVYVNGVEVGSGEGSQLWTHSGDINLGATGGATIYHDGVDNNNSEHHFFHGKIDEVNIYNRALTPGEIQALALMYTAGLQDSFDYTLTDNEGGTDTGTLTITIAEPNVPPIPTADFDAITEDTTVAIGGNVLSNDIDSDNDQLSVADINGETNSDNDVAGTYGILAWDNNGDYSYTLDNSNPAVQALAAGTTTTDVFTYTVDDGQGGTASSTLTITITGTNDAPEITGDFTGTVAEDAAATLNVAGDLLISDIDTGESAFTPATIAGTYGSLTINAAGHWEYSADNSQTAIQQLGTGDTLDDVISVTSVDGTTQDLTITITGTNDAPVATADTHWVQESDIGEVTMDINGNVLEDITHTGAPLGTYADQADTDIEGDNLTVTGIEFDGTPGSVGTAIAGEYGTLTINSDGSYTYDVDDANYDFRELEDGETLSDEFTYTVSDGEDTATATLTIDLFGTDNNFNVTNSGTAGNDLIWGRNQADLLSGGEGNDYIFGRHGDDVLLGGSGDDYILGDRGDDEIHGGAGADIIDAGRDNDIIFGDLIDTINGGTGDEDILNFAADVDGQTIMDLTPYDSSNPPPFTNIEFIDMTDSEANDKLILDKEVVEELGDNNDAGSVISGHSEIDVFIKGDSIATNDTIEFSDSNWSSVGTVNHDGIDYTLWQNADNSATVAIQDDLNVETQD